jgi:TonB family protein
MSATAQHLLGQLADGRFPLRKLLGVSQNSAVFLTSEPVQPGDPAPDIAIKLIPEDPATSDLQLEHWRAAAALSHPGLLRIHHFGRCAIDGSSCLYIVTERADEDLGQLLPRRALTPDETSGMLAAVLPTLDFLHENGFVHAGVKPSNIHATGDNVKLSADRIVPAGESASTWPLAAPFAAPESVLFPASDMWSLGVSICETLTKILPQQRPSGRFVLPELPPPYEEIVRSALVEDVTLRITLDQVRSILDPSYLPRHRATPTVNEPAASHVDPAPVDSPYIRPPEVRNSPESLIAAVEPSSAASPSTHSRAVQRQLLPEIDPLAVPLSPISPNASPSASRTVPSQPSRAPIPVTSLPQVNATIGSPRRAISPHPRPRSNKFFLVSAAAAVILAIIFVPRLILRSSKSSAPISANSSATFPVPSSANPSPSSNSAESAESNANSTATSPGNSADLNPQVANSTGASSAATNPPTTTSPAPNSNSRTNKNNPSAKSESPSASASSRNVGPPSPAAALPPGLVTHAPSNVNPAAPSIAAPAIRRKVLPVVSEKARSTIHGSVRINVRVQLNPDGTVSSVELAAPAPSQFFAELSLKAARQWQFAPPSSSDALPSSTVVRFDFTRTSTAAYLP